MLWHIGSTADPAGALQTIILDFCAVARTHRNRNNLDYNVTNACAFINNYSNKTKKNTDVKITFLHANHQNSRHVSNYFDHCQGDTEHQQSIY